VANGPNIFQMLLVILANFLTIIPWNHETDFYILNSVNRQATFRLTHPSLNFSVLTNNTNRVSLNTVEKWPFPDLLFKANFAVFIK